MENTYASKHFFFNKKYLSYNQNLTAICSGYTLPAGYAKISMPYTSTVRSDTSMASAISLFFILCK